MSNTSLKAPLWIITLIVALPQLSETIYTPSLPEIANFMRVSQGMVEYTLSIYLVGFAAGVAVWGNLSDFIGRKLGLYLGLGVYIVACLGCYASASFGALMFWRFLQAFGASTGSVIGQAIARDAIPLAERGKAYSTISMAMAFAPAVGPLIGGFSSQYGGWASVFLVLVVLGAFIALQVKTQLSETYTRPTKRRAVLSLLRECSLKMVKDKRILAYGFLVGGVNGIIFGYFAEAPFYYIEMLGMAPSQFGIVSLSIGLPLAMGGYLSRRLHTRKWAGDQIIVLGIGTIVMAALGLCGCTYLGLVSVVNPIPSIVLSLLFIMVIMVGVTMIIPNCLSVALEDFGHYAGTAASLFGFYYYALIAFFTWAIGTLHNGSLVTLPAFVAGLGVLMFAVKAVAVKKIPT